MPLAYLPQWEVHYLTVHSSPSGPCLIPFQMATIPFMVGGAHNPIGWSEQPRGEWDYLTSFVLGTQLLLMQPRILELPWEP